MVMDYRAPTESPSRRSGPGSNGRTRSPLSWTGMTPPRPIANADDARALFAGLADERREVAEAVYLDPEWMICGRTRFVGNRGHVTVSIRTLVAEALAVGAARVVLAHNHPSGVSQPSADDLAFSRRLQVALSAIEIPLVDHLIVGGTQIVSLREQGFL